MCLIVFALDKHPKYQLILGANRDEFFNRPTLSADWWHDYTNILGGRDEQGGGTWLGLNKQGKLAALTNYRDPKSLKTEAPSRGQIVQQFLFGSENITQYLNLLKPKAKVYNGFNLLLYNSKSMVYFSNYARPQILKSGCYELSNAELNSNWYKVQKSKTDFKRLICRNFDETTIFELLYDTKKPQDKDLPQTGLSLEWERALASIFIQKDNYGTRCSTVVLISYEGEVQFYENTYNPYGQLVYNQHFNFYIDE